MPAPADDATPMWKRAVRAVYTPSLADITAGTLGGIAGKLIEFPFDTIKVLAQSACVAGAGGWVCRVFYPQRISRTIPAL